MASAQHPVTPSQDIFVNVAGKLYRTTRAVLTKSPFFRYHLTIPSSRDSDGALVVNADPEIFEYILQYLQHGVYPLFIDPTGHHDIPKYLACAREARYFHLDRLVDWLEQGRYAAAYRIELSHRILRGEGPDNECPPTPAVSWEGSILSVTLSEASTVDWGKHLVALCPRGVKEHRGRKDECWKSCFKGREVPSWEHDVIPYPVFSLTVKKLIIDHNILRDQNW